MPLLLGMAPPDKASRAVLSMAQGRILEMVADGGVYEGPLIDLAQELGLTPADLVICLREIVQARWIAVRTEPFGRLTIRLERRTADSPDIGFERRRQMPDAWTL